MTEASVTLDFEHANSFCMLQRSWYDVTLYRFFFKLQFNTKHTIYSTFLQRCSFKCILLIQIRGHAVTYRSAIGHTVSHDANSHARVHQVWTLERSEMWNVSHGLAFPVWRIRMRMNGSQWNEKCSVTSPWGAIAPLPYTEPVKLLYGSLGWFKVLYSTTAIQITP